MGIDRLSAAMVTNDMILPDYPRTRFAYLR